MIATNDLSSTTGRILLTESEEVLWRHQLRYPFSPAYNVCAAIEIEGQPDTRLLYAASRALITQHPTLHSAVDKAGSRFAWSAVPCEPRWHLKSVPATRSVARWMKGPGAPALQAEARRPFLPGDVLHRLVLWDLKEVGALLQITVHHCACDGLSLRRLVNELMARYAELAGDVNTRRSAHPIIPNQPMVTLSEARDFFAPRLELAESTPLLPGGRNRERAADYNGISIQRLLDVSISEVDTRSKAVAASPFAVVIAAIGAALIQFSGEREVAARVPFSHRTPTEDLEISYRVRALPVRLHVQKGDSVATLLARVGVELRNAAMHADWGEDNESFITRAKANGTSVTVVNQLAPAGLLTHHRAPAAEIAGLKWRTFLLSNGTAKFDLSIHVAAHKGRLALTFEYRTNCSDHTERVWFADLVAAAVTDAVRTGLDRPAASLGLTSGQTWATRGRHTQPPRVRLPEAFFAYAAEEADRFAVVDDTPTGAHVVTYGQLAAASLNVVERLIGLGIRAGEVVGICLPRSAALVAIAHAVLRAKGVLLLLDPDLPPARADFMLANSRAHLLIEPATADARDAHRILGTSVRITIKSDLAEPVPLAQNVPTSEAAYVMYTSGSTGRPKGVVVSHGGIANRLDWMQSGLPIGPDNVVLAKTALSFDVCLWELFWPLMTGATLVTASHGRHADPSYLCELLDRYNIDTLHFVPAMLPGFLNSASGRTFPALRRIITSGERLPVALARRVHSQLGAEVHNLYGPTEASIDVTRFSYRPGDGRAFVPIGRPVDNTTARICDDEGRDVHIGAVGELVVEGEQIALGYVGDGSLDKGRFAINPYTGERTYRTGDLARWRSGGVLEFLGRADSQVKINGQRVELEELDAIIAEHPDVIAGATSYQEGAGLHRLHAFVVCRSGVELQLADLRAHIAEHFSAALIPTLFTVVESLPYSTSGKLDRTRLASLVGRDISATPFDPSAPTTGCVPNLLVSSASEVLGMAEVPHDVDLFHLGLDSITALRLVAFLNRGGAGLEVADIFEARTLAALAVRLRPLRDSGPTSKGKPEFAQEVPSMLWRGQEVVTHFPLSQLQLGLLYHREVSDDYLTYITSYEIDGEISTALLREAISQVAARHEFLRSAIELGDAGGPRQIVLKSIDVELLEHDLVTLTEVERQMTWDRWRHSVRTCPFSWDRPPLFAFHLHRFAAESSMISIVEPFLDGWSVAVLGRDILDTYERLNAVRSGTPPAASAQPLTGSLTPSYRRFVELEQAAATDEQALAYWRGILGPDTAWRLALAPGPPNEPKVWNRWDHYLEDAEVSALRRAADSVGVSLRTLMWAVHMRTVALFTGRDRSGSAIMVNGRPEESGGEHMVGLFLNILPVVAVINPGTTWRDLVVQMVATEQSLWRYRRTPYAQLRSLSPGLEPSCLFNYTEFHPYWEMLHDPARALRLRSVTALDQTYLDLTVQCSLEPTGRMRLSIDHRSPAVTPENARRFLAFLVHASGAVARDVDAAVDKDRIPPAESRLMELVRSGPSRVWPNELSLARVVDAHAARRPTAVAVQDSAESYSYADLSALSCSYAHQIRRRTARENPVVGVMASRSARYWAAVLGIWRAGGTYVALSPDFPAERLEHMAAESGVELIFLDSRDRIHGPILPTIPRLDLGAVPTGPIPSFQQYPLADTAYILFTSGSTGKPKGVRIGPAEMVNHWWAKTDLLDLNETCVIAQSAPSSFDVSIWQFAVPWLRGGRAVTVDDSVLLDPARLFRYLDETGVRLFESVPSHVSALLDAIDCGVAPLPMPRRLLDCLMVTGEAVHAEMCRRWLRAGGPPIVNAYGPTECADDITHHLIDDPNIIDAVPIGRPIPNIVCEVNDEHGRSVPLGVEGQLCVKGACLGKGYIDPGDEIGRFVRGQLHEVVEYRTGDRVQFNEAGELLWLGRIDNEVKVRGRRIELGDIESNLRTHPAVKEVAATLIDGPSGRGLRVVIVPRPGSTLYESDVREHLRSLVPGWMLPDEITLASNLPRTAHGKLDRGALATDRFARHLPTASAQVADQRGVAAIISEEWERVTGRAPTPDSDFFADGGTSLSCVRLIARISARLGRNVNVVDLLRTPRFAELTRLLALDPSATLPVYRTPAPVAGVITAALDHHDELLSLVPGGRIDAAAVGYFSSAALDRAGHPALEVFDQLGGVPLLRRLICTPLGVVGHYILPITLDEFLIAPDRLTNMIAQVADLAGRQGAQRVALTGMIPAATSYGNSVQTSATPFTTGHDVTTAAVVLNLARAQQASSIGWADQHLAVIGLGSIGRASTELLLQVLGHPASIALIESRKAGQRLINARTAIRAAGYNGPIRCETAHPHEVTDHLIGASAIVGAASAAGLIDIHRLASGTIVIDDSAPHLFDTAAAGDRVRAAKLYVSEGGVLEWPESLREICWMPTNSLLADVLGALRSYRPSPRTAMGCLTAALPALTGGMPPVLGEPHLTQTAAVYSHLVQSGFRGAPMMLDDTLLEGAI